MNYYRRYVGDYLKDTSRLSMLEHGAYSLLLDYYYAEERPIPLDLDEVFRMVRAIAPAERRAVERILATYFERREDGFHNARADEEIAIAQGARENGKKGGRPKTGNETELRSLGLPSGSASDPEKGTGSGHPPTTSHQPKKKTTGDAGAPPGFEEFWLAYPRKDGKQAALRAWRKLAAVDVPQARAGLERAKRSEQWLKDRGAFIPHASSWLNGRRWEDGGVQLAANAGAAAPCGNCGTPLTGGWSQSPKGRVCDECHRGYMAGAWPARKAA